MYNLLQQLFNYNNVTLDLVLLKSIYFFKIKYLLFSYLCFFICNLKKRYSVFYTLLIKRGNDVVNEGFYVPVVETREVFKYMIWSKYSKISCTIYSEFSILQARILLSFFQSEYSIFCVIYTFLFQHPEW